jgi:hypothetical protein
MRVRDVRDMGVDEVLLAAASAVPNVPVRFLERGELVPFGIDRREFGESVWHFADEPTNSMSKPLAARIAQKSGLSATGM